MNANSNKKLQINKRQKCMPRAELEQLSKKELIDRIVQLEAHNIQLKNLLQKKLSEKDRKGGQYLETMQQLSDDTTSQQVSSEAQTLSGTTDEQQKGHGKTNKRRHFDFKKMHKRHVLLRLLYFGWDYQGLACQEDSNDTIEHYLFKALERTCLIEGRTSSNYHRCGRTDKEVSAFCQVISIDLRSKFASEQQLTPQALAAEIDYCGLLNRVLPQNIQCVAWMPLRCREYSARFDCSSRTYRYYFPQGDLNIESMREACRLLERHVDFRNFCKMDVHNGVTNYVRNLQRATVQSCVDAAQDETGYGMYFLEIKANAFLWHQIRCIMAILLLVGQGKEEPQVINDLLDVSANPCKPQYMPALGLPLNLFHCEFRKHAQSKQVLEATAETATETTEQQPAEDDTTSWVYSESNLTRLIETVQSEWAQFSVKCTMILDVLRHLEATLNKHFQPESQVKSQVLLLQDSIKPKVYQKLLNRKRCESLENRIEHFVKKQRLVKHSVEDEAIDKPKVE